MKNRTFLCLFIILISCLISFYSVICPVAENVELNDANKNTETGPECNTRNFAWDLNDCLNLTRNNKKINVKCCYYHYIYAENDTHYRGCGSVTLDEFLDINKAIEDREDLYNIEIKSLECDKCSYIRVSFMIAVILLSLLIL